jgi:hypothetical protein
MLYQRKNDFYFPLNYFNADRYKSLQQAKQASYSLEDTRQEMVNAKNHSLHQQGRREQSSLADNLKVVLHIDIVGPKIVQKEESRYIFGFQRARRQTEHSYSTFCIRIQSDILLYIARLHLHSLLDEQVPLGI